MKTITRKLAVFALTIATLSACAPMTPPQNITINTPENIEHTGMVAPPVITQIPTPVPVPLAQQQYVVQLIASSSATKAEGIKNRFTNAGYSTFVSPLDVNGKLLHRVQIGYYNNQRDAEMTLTQMRQRFPGDTYVSAAVVKTP